jgi:cytochrome c
VQKAHEGLLMPEVETDEGPVSPGEALFNNNCAVCHAANNRLVGPPLTEVVPIYENNSEDLKKWIKEPGRKRMDYPPMAGFSNLTDQELTDISKYLLEEEWN